MEHYLFTTTLLIIPEDESEKKNIFRWGEGKHEDIH